MRGLTLWRPWSDAIVHGPKRVENRLRPPPASVLGELIAIHAGRKYGFGNWTLPSAARRGYEPPNEAKCPRGIVGVARVVGYLDLRGADRVMKHRVDLDCGGYHDLDRLHALDEDPWWVGPVGWLLDDVVAFPEPIPHRGMLGLWRVPIDKVGLVALQLSPSAAAS